MLGYYPLRGPKLSKTLVFPVFPSISTLVSTTTLNQCQKPRQLAPTVGLTRFIYVRSMAFESTSKFMPGSRLLFGSLLFIIDKMRDLICRNPSHDRSSGERPSASHRLRLKSVSHARHGSNIDLANQGNLSQIPQGITSTTTRSVALT
jgi:hypothetical protein